MPVFWLSFADGNKPKGQQCLGCVITEEHADIEEAAEACWDKGCNPGGEVVGWDTPEALPEWNDLPRYKLLTQGQLEEHGRKVIRTKDGILGGVRCLRYGGI